jgi:Tol biopolymer transport system component/predicted Ser/Thr protein kinase
MPLVEGHKLGPYEILALIGVGGMGEVYRARDTRLNRDVAIKVSKEQFTERFAREARAIAALNHPHICTLYDIGPNYLVMEYVEGAALKGPLSLDHALPIIHQLIDGIEAAHEKNIVHRDLKPANIRITPDGVVKILDFGLAKATQDTDQSRDPEGEGAENSPTLTIGATKAGAILGTAAYMSPEQAKGKTADRRSDIWSFGVVVYELLTGKRPFNGETVVETLGEVLHKEPDWTPPPERLRRLIQRCLQKDRKNRLGAIADARWMMEEEAEPAQATPAGSRGGLGWITAAVLALAALALAFVHFRQAPAPQPLTRFSVDLGPEAVAGVRVTAAISPDGRRLAFVARGAGGKEQLATRLLDQANPTLLPGTDDAGDPFFSPDSQWIGFFAEGKMKKISVQGGASVTLCDVPSDRGASWGEDGNIVVTLDSAAGIGLSRVAAAGGTPRALTKPEEKGDIVHRWPQILPGGQAVLFTGSGVNGDFENAGIEVLLLKTGQWKTVQKGGYFGRFLATSSGAGHLVYVHQGTLFAVPFDPARLEALGAPVPVLEDIAADPNTAAGQFDVSPTGTFVYLSGKSATASGPIAWLDSAGKTEPLLAAPGAYLAPRLSPDGKRLAVTVNAKDIQVYDWQRDSVTRLTFTGQNSFPVWSPDGRHIVFQSSSSAGNFLQWIRSDGAGEAQQLLESKNDLRPYSFSPDGKRLAFSGNTPGGQDLWTLSLDLSDPEHPKPGKPEIFLRTVHTEYEPAFSPDGRWIAYRSFESGAGDDVYVRPFPGPGGKWPISAGGGRHPIWSRNGRELFYKGAGDRIMVAAYTSKGDSFAADKPHPWSNVQILDPNANFSSLDLAPDGKRFAVLPRPEGTGGLRGSVHVTVLLNFFDELRRKVPAGK